MRTLYVYKVAEDKAQCDCHYYIIQLKMNLKGCYNSTMLQGQDIYIPTIHITQTCTGTSNLEQVGAVGLVEHKDIHIHIPPL